MRKKLLFGLLTSLVLSLSMSFFALASTNEVAPGLIWSEPLRAEINPETEIISFYKDGVLLDCDADIARESTGIIRAVLTCMFTRDPLIAEFNSESGMTLYYQYGKLLEYYDDNQTVDSFRNLIRANYIAANPAFCPETRSRIYRNTTVYDDLTRNVYEYDMDGNVTVTSYDEKMRTINVLDENGNVVEITASVAELECPRNRQEIERARAIEGAIEGAVVRDRATTEIESTATAIQPSSSNGWPLFGGNHNAPPSPTPEFGPPIGGRWYTPPSSLVRYMDIEVTQTVPANRWHHAFFTNQAGNNFTERMNFKNRAFGDVDFRTHPYQARMTFTMPGAGGSLPIPVFLEFT